jgi:V8-like Glu-specific endopeptidase
MENIKKENIILENGEIVDFKNLKKIMNSGLKKCVCIIFTKEKLKYGTGFFCNIKQKNMKVIITNNHIIDKEFLNKEKRLNIKIEEEEKEINLELNRYKMTDDNLDYTIIEIIKEDNINNYIDIDENIYIDNYINNQIFCMQYPGGKELKYSHGRINGKKNGLILYSIESGGGSSGSPILLFNNLKVIGLHKGCIYDKKKIK